MSCLADRLLAWYDQNRRVLPWRAAPGKTSDPYRVWLSEVMLQQTTVAAVRPYYQKFVQAWPTVVDLASAPDDDVMAAWAGLGYYARARNLLACARAVVTQWGGHFPDTEHELRKLPGIGPYTAAAIAAIAFHRRAVVVDGNVERVMARFWAVTDPLPHCKKHLWACADVLTPEKCCGDYAQAVMDLGATVCTPRSPACEQCPWQDDCQGRHLGVEETLPRKIKSKAKPTRYGMVFWLIHNNGTLLLRRRPKTGLLGGMMEFPSAPWQDSSWDLSDAIPHIPVPATDLRVLPGYVRHTFSHFHLELMVCVGRCSEIMKNGTDDLQWLGLQSLEQAALPSVMRKVAQHVLHELNADKPGTQLTTVS